MTQHRGNFSAGCFVAAADRGSGAVSGDPAVIAGTIIQSTPVLFGAAGTPIMLGVNTGLSAAASIGKFAAVAVIFLGRRTAATEANDEGSKTVTAPAESWQRKQRALSYQALSDQPERKVQ